MTGGRPRTLHQNSLSSSVSLSSEAKFAPSWQYMCATDASAVRYGKDWPQCPLMRIRLGRACKSQVVLRALDRRLAQLQVSNTRRRAPQALTLLRVWTASFFVDGRGWPAPRAGGSDEKPSLCPPLFGVDILPLTSCRRSCCTHCHANPRRSYLICC